MKKFYLLLTALLVAGVAKANLTFYLGDTKIEPNSTVTFNEVQKEFVGSWEVMIAPKIYVESDIFSNKINVNATCTTGQTVQMCYGGCQVGTSVDKTVKANANNKVDLEFEFTGVFDNEADIPTDITVHFTAQDGNKLATKLEFDLILNSDKASLTLVESNAKPVRYTSAGLEYNLDGRANVALYDITGRQVLNFAAEGQGTVNTHSLHTGIYLYSVRTASGAKHTGKIYVK